MSRYPTNSLLVSYSVKGKGDAITVPSGKQMQVQNARAINNSGGAIDVAICRKQSINHQKLWKLTTGGTVFTDVTSSISAGVNLFSGTNSDGYVLQSDRKFNLVGFTVSAANGSGVYTYKYWNGASYATLTTLEVPVYSATGDIYTVFRAPYDWVAGGTSVDSTKYSLQVISTTGPAGAVTITNMWVGEFIDHYSGVADKAAVQVTFPDSKPFVLEGGESLFPYFSTANAANAMGIFYTFN